MVLASLLPWSLFNSKFPCWSTTTRPRPIHIPWAPVQGFLDALRPTRAHLHTKSLAQTFMWNFLGRPSARETGRIEVVGERWSKELESRTQITNPSGEDIKTQGNHWFDFNECQASTWNKAVPPPERSGAPAPRMHTYLEAGSPTHMAPMGFACRARAKLPQRARRKRASNLLQARIQIIQVWNRIQTLHTGCYKRQE